MTELSRDSVRPSGAPTDVAVNLEAEFEDPFLKGLPEDAGAAADDEVQVYEPPLLQDSMERIEMRSTNLGREGSAPRPAGPQPAPAAPQTPPPERRT